MAKMDLQKSKEMKNKIELAEWPVDLNRESEQLQQEIELANERADEVESVDGYYSILQEIKDLEEKQQEVKVKRRIRPKEKDVEIQKIKDTYNEEFQPYYDKYVKLDNKLKKQLTEFAKAIDSIVQEMVEIENLEASFHMLKLKSPEFSDIYYVFLLIVRT